MALIVSREQLNRILNNDGMLQLWPAYTESGSQRFAHACVGEPFARIHVGEGNDAQFFNSRQIMVYTGPMIKKIDAMEITSFFPTYVYLDKELMMWGKLDRFYMSLLKAIHRPYLPASELTRRQQFMAPGEGTDEKVDDVFLQYLEQGSHALVHCLCEQKGFNIDKLLAYMTAHNHTAESLAVMLRNKWVD